MTSVRAVSDGWRLRGFLGDDWQLHRAQLHARERRDDEHRWVPARVPGTVLADLLAAGQVPDPYVGTQSLLSEWVPQRTWVYRTRLRPPPLGPAERAFLEFDGIDYAADVYLDGDLIAGHEGTFVPLVVEVTGGLLPVGRGTAAGRGAAEPGTAAEPAGHSLAVVVKPAPVSEPQVGDTAAVRVHKGRMGYGWDFCPRLVHQGLWAPVRLRTTGPLRLADVWARPTVAGGSGRVSVTLEVDAVAAAGGGSAELVLRDPAGATAAAVTVPLTGATTRVLLDVPEPRRWRPNGLGEAHLYALSATVRDATGGRSDERHVRVGFRDARFERDAASPPAALPYRLVVGGRPVPVKGWNWVPADALYGTVRETRLRHLLGLARDAGVNVLRVWGGGLVESDTFYDLCDEFGILVWQEFAQSSSGMSSLPSDDDEFVARMAGEAERIVPARRNHPSLVLWCGGNELQRADGVPLTDADAPVLTALRDVVARLDPDRQWLPTSPSGPVFGNSFDSLRPGPGGDDGPEHHDVHGPWEHQGLSDHYRLYDAGRSMLLSEFGVEGMSNLRAIESVVPARRRVLPTAGDPVWDHLGRWWNNEPLVREAFGGAAGDIATLARASQFLQADGLRYAVEANRRRPESCGVLPWQLNESFPNGWCTAAVDYFGEPKAAYHYVRRAYRPLHVCAALPAARVTGTEFAATVWAWSDAAPGGDASAPGGDAAAGIRARGERVHVTARVLRLDGSEIVTARWTAALAEGRPRRLGRIRCPAADLGGGSFLLDLSVRSGDRTRTNRYTLTAGTDFRDLPALAPARVSGRLRTGGARWELRLRHEGGPVAAFLRLLDARAAAEPGLLGWDDNAFDLLPGEGRVLRARWDGVAPERRRVLLDGWNVAPRVFTEVDG